MLKNGEDEFPKIKIRNFVIKQNAEELTNRFNINFVGVAKGVCADTRIISTMINSGIKTIGDSRIKNLKKINKHFNVNTMLLRIPMISEADNVIKYSNYSLNSEKKVLEKLSKEAQKQQKTHKPIVMVDVGDRREGVLPENTIQFLKKVKNLPNLKITGIGSNLGCFGGILPTKKNKQILIDLVEEAEKELDLELPIISGGSTIELKMLEQNKLPKKINQLRIGEAILLGTSVSQNREIPYLRQDAFEIEAEIIELKKKPSKPQGKTGKDAFGKKPEFQDKGKRKRAIIAIGKQDTTPKGLKPINNEIEVLGASSDHTILDIQNTEQKYETGDKIKFTPNYSALLKAFTSNYVKKQYIN